MEKCKLVFSSPTYKLDPLKNPTGKYKLEADILLYKRWPSEFCAWPSYHFYYHKDKEIKIGMLINRTHITEDFL